jgi:hypothetical protein
VRPGDAAGGGGRDAAFLAAAVPACQTGHPAPDAAPTDTQGLTASPADKHQTRRGRDSPGRKGRP